MPVVLRGPHEYSVPGASEDYLPQFQQPRSDFAVTVEER